jgi:periplasmic protein TonB
MAFRALLSSQKSETNAAVAAACKSAGIRAEVCADIFTAIEKGKTKAFSCVIADWADQPEASFLLRRARESASNRDTVAIAVVDREPTAAEIRDNRLDFLIYRPISAEAAQTVLTKAREKMPPLARDDDDDDEDPSEKADAGTKTARSITAPPEPAHPDSAQLNSSQREPAQAPQNKTTAFAEPKAAEVDRQENAASEIASSEGNEGDRPRVINIDFALVLRGALAVMLVATAAFCLWRSRDTVEYLSQTREGRFQVLRESVAAFFYLNKNAALPVSSVGSDAQQDAYFSRNPAATNAPAQTLKVVAPESAITEAHVALPTASDFPQPMPVFEHQEPAPLHRAQAVVPESMRNSPPIAPPEVVAVNATQMMPVSVPQSSAAIEQSGEPVAVSEEAARALLIHTVNPSYPPEALTQKLHGTVVLQVVVARDGSVEDVKMVRGYFILAQAAIAAVKQWRFEPYTLNGHAAATQTAITINFSYPPG